MINKSFFSVLFLILFCIPAFAETEPKAGISIFDAIYGTELLEVTIKTNIQQILDNRNSDAETSAIFTYKLGKKETKSFPVKLETRGKYRRKICDFPPIKVKFQKEALAKAGFNNHNDYKIVTHCVEGKLEGDANVVKEYLAYKLYNEVTPFSYRVILLRITYEDEAGVLGKIKRYGILIEDTDQLAERMAGEETEQLNPSVQEISRREAALVSVFQFMIGNSDWSIAAARNVKFVRTSHTGLIKMVPYDFDFSGLVNTGYAKPNSDYNQTSIKERIYLGIALDKNEVDMAVNSFARKWENFQKIILKNTHLSSDDKEELLRYLFSFFENAENFKTNMLSSPTGYGIFFMGQKPRQETPVVTSYRGEE